MAAMNKNMDYQVIYIASASRSGSTMLEHLLGGRDGVINCGEIRRTKNFYNEDTLKVKDSTNSIRCTCGERVRSCQFWSEVQTKSKVNFAKSDFSSQMGTVNRCLFKLVFFVFGPRVTRLFSQYYPPFDREIQVADNCFRVFSAISTITDSKCLVDSSKMIHHYLMLKVARPDNVNLLALVRDGRAVSTSLIRGERIKFFKNGRFSENENSAKNRSRALKSAILSWASVTLQILIFYVRTPRANRFLVRYEEIASNPEEMINSIASKLCKDPKAMSLKEKNVQSHSIGGSPSRLNPNFNKIEMDEKWKNDWSKSEYRLFARYGALLNKLMGYK